MALFDSDGSGQIDYEEFFTVLTSYRIQNSHRLTQASKMGNGEIDDKALEASEEDRRTWKARKRKYVLFYSLCFVLVAITLIASVAMLFLTTTSVNRSAAELNNAGRRRWLAQRMYTLACDLVWSQDRKLSLLSGFFTIVNSTDVLRCNLRRTAETLLMVHYALQFGTYAGFSDMPKMQKFAAVEQREPDTCSPLTWDSEWRDKSKELPGSFGREAYQDETVFGRQCLTSLDLDRASATFTEQRILSFSSSFDGEVCNQQLGTDVSSPNCSCTMYLAGDPAVMQGLHNLIVSMADAALALAETPDDELRPTNVHYRTLLKYHGREWMLGLVKSSLIYQVVRPI